MIVWFLSGAIIMEYNIVYYTGWERMIARPMARPGAPSTRPHLVMNCKGGDWMATLEASTADLEPKVLAVGATLRILRGA